MGVLPDYDGRWKHLSVDHEEVDKEVQQVLDNYVTGSVEDLAHAVIGTYGAGKTQFLYHIHKSALKRGIVPLYFLAEDLFQDIISGDRDWTPGDLYSSVEEKVRAVREALCEDDPATVREILDPRGKLQADCPQLVSNAIEEFTGKSTEKSVLLVDELEGQYGILQERVQTRDRSPLREWLESTTHLKFLAFAPAGIYGLGGADASRVRRKVIPAADIRFARENLLEGAGASNACWWLSRGKARQLFKTAEALDSLKSGQAPDPVAVSKFIRMQLDPIGQAPTEVPPAVLHEIQPRQYPFLVNLAPIDGESRRRYVIETESLDTGELAEKLIEAFGIRKDNAVLIAYYFKKTASVLADLEWRTYIERDDLPEFFCLSLDHLLEYEHGNRDLSESFGEVLSLYDRSRKEQAEIYGTVGRLFELKETDRELPLSMKQVRAAFPFPTMNPMVRDHVPGEMQKEWEGRGLPLWKWTEDGATLFFFASARDFTAYSRTDEFLSSCLPDGRSGLCLLPTGEAPEDALVRSVVKWLIENRKLKVTHLQHLVSDFLFSASGEIERPLPGDLERTLTIFRENQDDVLLSRKTEIYQAALQDVAADELPRPRRFDRGHPPAADDVWGSSQISRVIAVRGITLAFQELRVEEKRLLVELRELFRGGTEGRGSGDLQHLISGRGGPPGTGGHTRLPDRLLPYEDRRGMIKDTEVIERLRIYWGKEDRDTLGELARILPLDKYLRLYANEDKQRLLEALWRSVRREFEVDALDDLISRLETEVIPVLRDCDELERLAAGYAVTGVEFEDDEELVKSLPGFEKLLDLLKKSVEAEPLVKAIEWTLASEVDEKSHRFTRLKQRCDGAQRTLHDLEESFQNLEHNFFWECEKAVEFTGLDEEDLQRLKETQLQMSGRFNPKELEDVAREGKTSLDDISLALNDLEEKLKAMEACFIKIRGEV